MPLERLPFATIVVASTNDEYVSMERAALDYWATRTPGGALRQPSSGGDDCGLTN